MCREGDKEGTSVPCLLSPPRQWGGPGVDKPPAVGRRAGCWWLAPPTANLEGKPEEAM